MIVLIIDKTDNFCILFEKIPYENDLDNYIIM